jgi:hypothetical protein
VGADGRAAEGAVGSAAVMFTGAAQMAAAAQPAGAPAP